MSSKRKKTAKPCPYCKAESKTYKVIKNEEGKDKGLRKCKSCGGLCYYRKNKDGSYLVTKDEYEASKNLVDKLALDIAKREKLDVTGVGSVSNFIFGEQVKLQRMFGLQIVTRLKTTSAHIEKKYGKSISCIKLSQMLYEEGMKDEWVSSHIYSLNLLIQRATKILSVIVGKITKEAKSEKYAEMAQVSWT